VGRLLHGSKLSFAVISSFSKRPGVLKPLTCAQLTNFKRPQRSSGRIENANLSYNHGAFDVWTDRTAPTAGLWGCSGCWTSTEKLADDAFEAAHGAEGLIAEVVRVEMEGGRISADEMISMVLLLGMGSETTTHLISGSVYELLKNPTLARLA
jgi:cytochrome P450